jgi:hypothetical protein
MESAAPGMAAMAFPMVRTATAVSTIKLFIAVNPLFYNGVIVWGRA